MGDRGSHDGDDPGPERGRGLDAQLDRIVPSESAAAFLMVVSGDQPGRVHPLSKNTIVIGRSSSADIRISDRSVSSEHARILNGGAGFEIEDLSSTNGTFVGARKVMRSRLKNGDRVRIGSVEFAFLVDRESDATIALISAANVGVRRETISLPPMAGGRSHDSDEGVSLREMVHKGVDLYLFLRRYALVIGFLLGAGGTLGFASAFVLPPAPVAFCQVKLSPAPKNNPVGGDQYRPPAEGGDTVQFFEAAETAFTNSDLIRQTLRNLGDATPSQDTISSVASRLSFTTDGNHIYKATYKETMLGSGRRSPVEFLSVHMQNYLEAEISKILKLFTAQAAFYRNRSENLDKELKQIDAELVQFQAENADSLPGQALQTYSSSASMESRRIEISSQLHRLESELANSRRQIATDRPLAPWREQAAGAYRTQLAEVNRKLAEARARGLGDEHPDVMALNKDRASVEKMMSEQLSAPASALERQGSSAFAAAQTNVDSLEAQVRALRAEAGDIDRNLAKMRKVMVNLPRVEGRMQDLQRERDNKKRLFDQILQEQQRAEVQFELEKARANDRYELVSRPQLEQVKRRKTMAIRTAMGLGAGILLAAIFILLREARRIVAETMNNGPRPRGYVRT